jgi:anti-sigma regulatory factor (Ser/Thr protein kinase)
VELTLFTDPAIPAEVLGDAGRLRQVLTNLVSNAIKFSGGREQPGLVSVRAVLAEHSPDRVVVEICIADNGIGMDEETLSGLFTPFTQADASTTRRFGGTGLGLAIAHHLVELMGGEIAVQSTPGKGSIFTVRLSFVPLPAKADADAAKSPVTGLSCLVVGDFRKGWPTMLLLRILHTAARPSSGRRIWRQRRNGAGSPGLWGGSSILRVCRHRWTNCALSPALARNRKSASLSSSAGSAASRVWRMPMWCWWTAMS